MEINPITNKRIDRWELQIRKLAHYVLFALGGFVIYLGLELCFGTKQKVLISIFCGMLMACIDELHQLYSSNRGPMISDVALDTLGVISGVLAAKVIVEIIKKINNKLKKGSKIYDKLQKNNCRKTKKSG